MHPLRREFPILEFDPARQAVITPQPTVHYTGDAPPRCVLCFFREVVDGLAQAGRLREIERRKWEDDTHPLYELQHNGERLTVLQPGVGAPLSAGLLEAAISLGCNRFIACGGAGVLNGDMALGHVVVPSSAVRDEGTSYHYLPPAREVEASPAAVAAIEGVLAARGIPYVVGKTWTTDAPYRETPEKVRLRRAEGCLTVEMEAAAFFAVAQFRGVTFGQLLYGGDDVSSDKHDHRGWDTQTSLRGQLFWLAVAACLML